MTEYVHPDNPFPVSDNFKEVTPALISSAIEAVAFVSQPALDDVPADLLVAFANHWALRITGIGNEDTSYAVVWELSAMISRYMSSGILFPPFDITTTCEDDECQVDHGTQTRVINDLFAAGLAGDHQQAVKSYAEYVHSQDPAMWTTARVEFVAMLLVHVAERVSEWRSSKTVQLPSLD